MAKAVNIPGQIDGERVLSRILEERVQLAVEDGAREIEIEAMGQHGIGGRLWSAGDEPVNVKVTGSPGQRLGSMGFPNTRIEVFGPASDDTGWLNGGAEIVIHGNAANGTCNAMAQGRVYVEGNIGGRGMTMTKRNPRFDPPELWVLGSAGDYFAEFMAGGVVVVCGVNPQDAENVLGHRPCVGMVGGKIYFRGPIKGYAQADAKMVPIDDDAWKWLTDGLDRYLAAIGREELKDTLAVRDEWQLIEARMPYEKTGRKRRSMADFHANVWDAELGRGGMIGDLTDLDRAPIPLVVHGELRRFMPVWENKKYEAPCQASCPSGIPVQERWRLIRDGLVDDAMDLALAYTPFPATVCGYLCPNLCMQGCTRGTIGDMRPVDVSMMGRAGLDAPAPKLPPITGKRVAVIGGGPGGISTAWQLRMNGHDAVVYDMEKKLGGKIVSAIPESRIPKDVVEKELERVAEVLPHIHLQQKLTKDEFEQLKADFDFIVLATGAGKPRKIPVPGSEMALTALEFLRDAKAGTGECGKKVVIIGAGNVGCDVATEAARLGAESIQLIDIQTPAAFGKEKEEAEHVGATFRWPCFTKEISSAGVTLTDGETIPADTVIFAIGDAPELDFLPENIATERGHVVVDDVNQTTDTQVFAIGDVVRPGLLTDAIGQGRNAAEAIHDIASGKRPQPPTHHMIDYSRMTLEYFDPRMTDFVDIKTCAEECSSCGSCRDCGLCEVICPQHAITRVEENGKFEMICDAEKCIGCGFCASGCPCGIWQMLENTPL